MGIEYGIIAPKPEDVLGMLPPWVCISLERNNTLCFGAIEDNMVFAIAVYSFSVDSEEKMVLEYIYVDEEHRGKKISTSIMKYAEEIFKKNGVKNVMARYTDTLSKVKENYGYLIHRGFIPLSLNRHLLVYYWDDLKDTDFMGEIEKQRPMTNAVKRYNKLYRKPVNEFVEKEKAKGNYARVMLGKNTVAYVNMEGTEAKAVLSAETIDEFAVVIGDFSKETGYDESVLGTMIAKIFIEKENELYDGTMILLNNLTDEDYAYVQDIFGEGEHDLFIQGYLKKI